MNNRPKISICIPIHNMENRDFFLNRCLESIKKQTFTDYEIVVTEEGKMAENTNAAIKKAKGEIIKILFMDDYLHNEYALQRIIDVFTGGWLATGCMHDNGYTQANPHMPFFNARIYAGVNTIGSPSVIAFENDNPLLFDESLSWMLDCDLYSRLHTRYGEPTYLLEINTVIGIGNHQTTHKLTDDQKNNEVEYVTEKHERNKS